jgi:hypothetical protein
MASAIREWLGTYPAVRVQHRKDYPAGKGLEAWQDDEGATWVKSLVVDDAAKRMVRKGVLRAYSVGMDHVVTQPSAMAKRFFITGGTLTEVSLCDRPANTRCGITIAKSGQYVGTAYRVTKSGKIKVTKPGKEKVKPVSMTGDYRAYVRWMAQSPDPLEREWAYQQKQALNVQG